MHDDEKALKSYGEFLVERGRTHEGYALLRRAGIRPPAVRSHAIPPAGGPARRARRPRD